MFANNLKRIMKEKDITGMALASAAGFSKAAVSQYINGINIPSKERIEAIAEILGVTVDELIAVETDTKQQPRIQKYFGPKATLNCNEAAALLHKSADWIRTGLREGRPGFEYGAAVKTSGRWSYCIYANKFSEITGISLNDR